MKIVLVTQRIDYLVDRNETRDSLDQNIVTFLSKLGLTALPIPNIKYNQKEIIEQLIEKIEPVGIIISGGNNIGDYLHRDNLEFELIKTSINYKIPLIGICRGMQLINKFYGGILHKSKNHVNVRHDLKSIDDKKINVNSYHNYVINESPSQLETVLTAEDNTVEFFKHTNNLLTGIMWHPERENPFKKYDLNLFNSLFSL